VIVAVRGLGRNFRKSFEFMPAVWIAGVCSSKKIKNGAGITSFAQKDDAAVARCI
jgi:hypothetical protein